MKWTDTYQDICAQLQTMQQGEQHYRRVVEEYHAVIVEGKAKSSSRYFCHVPLDKAIENYNVAVDKLAAIQEEVDRLDNIKQSMDKIINGFDNLTNRIAAGRLQGKRYKDMELELGYSEHALRKHMCRHRHTLGTESVI